MAIELKINGVTFTVEDEEDLHARWPQIVDGCKWQGTGGDWRSYAREICELIHLAKRRDNCGQWLSSRLTYGPSIELKYGALDLSMWSTSDCSEAPKHIAIDRKISGFYVVACDRESDTELLLQSGFSVLADALHYAHCAALMFDIPYYVRGV